MLCEKMSDSIKADWIFSKPRSGHLDSNVGKKIFRVRNKVRKEKKRINQITSGKFIFEPKVISGTLQIYTPLNCQRLRTTLV